MPSKLRANKKRPGSLDVARIDDLRCNDAIVEGESNSNLKRGSKPAKQSFKRVFQGSVGLSVGVA